MLMCWHVIIVNGWLLRSREDMKVQAEEAVRIEDTLNCLSMNRTIEMNNLENQESVDTHLWPDFFQGELNET